MNTKKMLAKNTLIILFGKVFTQLLSFLLLPLYTAYLSTEDYGVTDLITTLVHLFTPIIILELEAGLFRTLIDHRKDKVKVKEFTQNVFAVAALLSVAFAGLFYIVQLFYKIQYGEYLLVYTIVNAFMALVMQYFRGVGNNVKYSIICCINGAAIIFLNILFIVVLGMGARGMLLAYILGGSSAVFVGCVLIAIDNRGIKAKWNLKEVKPILQYSIPLIFNSVSWWVMNASDRLIITAFMSLSANGIYAVSNKFSTLLFRAFGVFNLAWTEVVSVKQSEKDSDSELFKINTDISEALFVVCILVIANMFWAYPLLINEKYAEGYIYVPILIIAVFFNALGALLGGLLVARKESKNIAYTSFVGAALNVIINLLLIKEFGLYAASFSTLISYVAMFALRYKRLGKECIKFPLKRYLPAGLIFIGCLVAYYVDILPVSCVFMLISMGYAIWRYYKPLIKIAKRYIKV